MRPRCRWLIAAVPLLCLTGPSAHAVDYGAVGSGGDWNSNATWVSNPAGGTFPGANDSAYIGSNTPAGATSTASVNLTADQSVNNVNLGYGIGNDGTLNLGTSTLTVSDSVYDGWYGGMGTITRGAGGTLKATNFYTSNGNTFSFGSSDVINHLQIQNNAQVTLNATGNVTNSIDINNNSLATGTPATLTLASGVDLNLSGSLQIENGGVVAANGNDITANTILLGWYGGSGTLNQGGIGTVKATNFYISNGNTFSFGSSDVVSNLNIANNALVTLNATGNVTNSIDINNNNLATGTPATLTLPSGVDLNLSGSLQIENGGVVAANGNDITANTILLGWYGTAGAWSLTDRGNLNATNLYVNGNGASGPINLTAADSVGSFTMSNGATTNFATGASVANLTVQNNAQATLNATGNVTNSIDINNNNLATGTPATLTLASSVDLHLSGNLQVENGGVVAANGNDITANTILLGWYGTAGAWSLTDRGNLNATNLYVNGNGASGPINLTATDSVGNFTMSNGATTNFATGASVANLTVQNNAQATLTAPGNVTNNIDINNSNLATGTPATLTLAGTGLNLSGNLQIENGGILDANGNNITATNAVFVGWYSSTNGDPSVVNNGGSLMTNSLYMNHNSNMTITGGTIGTYINLQGDSVLTVQQAAGQTDGLTFLGTAANLIFDPSSIDLVFSDIIGGNWAFRWQDPSTGGDWISTIENLISAGSIKITSAHGYQVYDTGGYTYIGYLNAVPEPSSIALIGLGLAGLALKSWKTRRSAVSSPVA